VAANGADLATYPDESAGPSAPWLILSNSLGADHRMWNDQLAFFGRRYRVLRYDTRGHGGSGVTPGPYTLEFLSDEGLALMAHFGIETASFVGLSLGGMIGMTLALDHPDRIDRLVCCDARSDMPPVAAQGWDERIEAVRTGGVAAILTGTIERWLMPETR